MSTELSKPERDAIEREAEAIMLGPRIEAVPAPDTLLNAFEEACAAAHWERVAAEDDAQNIMLGRPTVRKPVTLCGAPYGKSGTWYCSRQLGHPGDHV